MDVMELAAHMRTAGCLDDPPTLIPATKPSIAVGLQHAAEPGQVCPWMLAAMVRIMCAACVGIYPTMAMRWKPARVVA